MSDENVTRHPQRLHRHEADDALENIVLAKVSRRLIPFLFLLYMLNILDRINIGFARLKMLGELEMSEEVYGLGAGIFFVGYFIFEVPSNLILKHTGARRWIGRIMISWGIVSACMMFVATPWGFCILRFLLGLAEAGFFPGVILYVSYWFPARQRAWAVSRFMTASAVTGIIGGPCSGAIMDYMHQVGGLSGWQWLFLLEGMPTIIVGFVTFYYLTDHPGQAHWLSEEERHWLVERMNREEKSRQLHHGFTLLQGLTNPRVLLLCLIYFTVAMGSTTYGSYQPQIIKNAFECSDFEVGLLSAIPSTCTIIAMIAVGYHSDRTGERRWHVAVPAGAAAVGWTMVACLQTPYMVLVGLALAHAGMLSMLAPFWSLPTSFLSGAAAAGGIAFINSLGNLGGLAGNYAMGQVKTTTGSYSHGCLILAGVLILGGFLATLARHDRASERPGGR